MTMHTRLHRLLALLLALAFCLQALHGGGLLDGFGLDSEAVEHEKDYTCEPKPPPKPPAQHSGAEGLPPLPLPAVPLRRTEKKNPPRAPVLIAKIATKRKSDWATNPGDTKNLLRWMAKNLDVHFSSMNIPEGRIPASAEEIPILYRTGHEAFEFSETARERLRQYLMNGGTLILDACCGRREFVVSALREMQRLVPERPPYRLTLDHPLYHSYFDITRPEYRPGAKEAGARDGTPGVIGIDIECRTAVFFFRWDVSCGWDRLQDSERHRCLGYTIDSAQKLGANLMAYITAERNVATPLSKALQFVDADNTQAGKFVIAQAKYHGHWKTREAALPMLLNSFHDQTEAPVRFESEVVAIESPRLFDVPFLYMTGHQAFEFTEAERRNLRAYLQRGGVLFAEACCGRAGFDAAFRAQIRRVFPDRHFVEIPAKHPLYMFPNRIVSVQPRASLARKLNAEGSIPPRLLGISIDGALSVVYSPYGLACGWELAQCPYCNGIEAKDALGLGVNILTYSLLQ